MENYKLNEIQSFRRTPDNYQSLSPEDKLKCDEEFYDSLSDKTKKTKHLFYYVEVVFDESEYHKSEFFDEPEKLEDKSKNLSFFEKAKLKHGDKYLYTLVKYVNSEVKVKITCPEHGVFEQRPTNHLQGQGCPKCGQLSRGETKRKLKLNKSINVPNDEVVADILKEDLSEYSPEFLDFISKLK